MSDYSVQDQYWIWLSSVEGIGPKRFYELLSRYGNPRDVWVNFNEIDLRFLGEAALRNLTLARRESYFYQIFYRMEQVGARAVTRTMDEYPRHLTSIYDPPPTLYVRGECPLNNDKPFAIVGSRRCTSDGRRAAKEFADTLAREQVCVISGLARGVDTCAHEGALDAGGKTIAVLGCGVDVVYPPENEKLMKRIIDNGGAVISEYVPRTQPLAGNFPARNRIISGMSEGVLLVEGAKGSGAMITIDMATEQGREVFAIPGSIYSPLSAMPNQLIIDGAHPVVSPWDVMEVMRWGSRPDISRKKGTKVELSEDEKKIAEPLYEQALTVTEIQNITGMTVSDINCILTTLTLRGIIDNQPGGRYRAYRPL